VHHAQAIVRSVSGDRAVVSAESPVCARCAAGKGCGAGLVGATGKAREMTVIVADGVHIAPGDAVSLSLPHASLTRAACYAYGLPLAGLLSGSALAALAGGGEAGALVGGIAGLAAGAMAGRRLGSRRDCISRMRPVISGIANRKGL